jgi:hypothetical protein
LIGNDLDFTKKIDLARSRTWNLLIRSQTRYPLRHKTLLIVDVFFEISAKILTLMLSIGEIKSLSEVGFEPTPTEWTRTLLTCHPLLNGQDLNLESGALDRSAILT